ncbi:MAG: mechanosensitive ion channel family protein [Tissierellia bacterium]|nr:mechanosensitive ion channel family protein [Tissierellia bacterium]
MQDLVRNIYKMARDDEAYGEKFFVSIVIILACVLLIKLVRRLSKKITAKEKLRYRINKTSYYLIVIAGILGILYTWFNALNGLVAALSVLIAFGIFSLKDLVLNLAGFAYINTKHPFSVGDRIEIEGVTGDVVDIDLFQFSLAETGKWLESMDHTGRVIFIPNQDIFKNPIANFSSNFPYIWKDILVPINHEDNIELMIEVLEQIGKDMLFDLVQKDQGDEDTKDALEDLGNRVQLFDGNILPKVHIRVHDSGVDCILRYLAPYREVSAYETEMWQRILKVINEHEDLGFSPKALRLYGSEVED